ncbi:MAG: type II secretion system F family protein, partial [Eubacterium sp.]|nr:type II secretion system F family protein [Eubacterium sp.]
TGVMSANNEQELHEKLKAEELFLISAKQQTEKKRRKRIKSDVLSEYARNISKLVGSGVTLVKALRIISEDESWKPREREVYADILRLVKSGMPLSDAMEAQGEAFPSLFVSMIRSSETSGNLDQVAGQMADYYNKDYKLRKKVKSSMTYPKILCVLIVIVMAVIMGFVIPQFKDLFAQMESLPPTTTILLAISNFVKDKWYILLFFAIVIVLSFKVLLHLPKIKYVVDKIKVKAPVVGKLMKVIYTARFSRTLASLYAAGISIINCLTIAQTTIDNAYIEKQFDQVIADVRAGVNLSDALEKVDGFTKKMVSSVRVGEETGTMDSMLTSIADQMEYDSEVALNQLVSYLEPAMIAIMAVVVGFVIISVIQPIYGSYESIADS